MAEHASGKSMALSISNGDTFTLKAAQKNERNILSRLKRSDCTVKLYHDLWRKRKTIEAITAHHLGRIEPSACEVQDTVTWIKGQFNTCIPVHVHESDGSVSKKIFRCPLAHKVGERYSPGAVDEKMRAEAGAYAWIEENCPEIPVPKLHGFGFTPDLQFTHREQGTGFTLDLSDSQFAHPYLLLEYIDRNKGKMLSETLRDYRDSNSSLVENLTRGICRIMLSLAKKAQASIGSLRFNDDTSVTLANRPLLCTSSILESEGAPKILDRTYKTCGHFIDDMLKFREEAFSAQPNAVNDEEDCYLQMLHITMLRLLKSQFVDSHSEGPFVLQLTDLHSSNIFVDDDWNIVAIIDLEFMCALPPSMINVPYWLTVDNIDDIAENMDAYNKMHKTFLDVLQDEEQKTDVEHDVQLASAIQESWTSYSSWFYRSLTSINGMAYCLEDHLYEKFNFNISREEEDQWMKLMSAFWPSDSKKFVKRKLREKAKYDEDVARHFEKKLRATSKADRISSPVGFTNDD